MGVMESIWRRAKSDVQHILLPEGTEPRMLHAARIITDEGIAYISLIGNREQIMQLAQKEKADLSGVGLIDPQAHQRRQLYIEKLVEMRRHKGMTPEKASGLLHEHGYYATMMVKLMDADGFVAGAASSTPQVWRPVLQIIRTRPGIKVASSCFLMEVPDCIYGESGVFIYADCGLNPNPNAEELASIALSAADIAKVLTGMEPRVAMLSFSTRGSADDPAVTKVQDATRIAKTMRPDLLIDGELQADAAIVPSVAARKCPDSPLQGYSNILIFPDLDAGNIAYKLTQRLAKAMALGPLSMGLARPVNDLSRGCSVQDIVNVVAITAIEAQSMKEMTE